MSKRSLTKGEIRLAHGIFAHAMNYDAVRVYDRGYAFLNATGNMSYRGNIYLPDSYNHDFSHAPLPQQRLFIHESVHVWQHQNNVLNLAMAALREGVKHQLHYAKAYLFRLEPGKDLLDYGLEQQAAIIEEYFLRQNGGALMGRCLNTDSETPALLDGVLKNFLDNPSYARRQSTLEKLARPARLFAGWTPSHSQSTDRPYAV